MSTFQKSVFVPVKQSLSFLKDKAFDSVRGNLERKNGKDFLRALENGPLRKTLKDVRTSISDAVQADNMNSDGLAIKNDISDISNIMEMHFKMMDQCFGQIRKVFLTTDKILSELATTDNNDKIPIGLSTFSNMDNVFFHSDKFEILIDARGFKPEDINCSITQKSVEVLAQKQDQSENSQKKVALSRQYILPQKAVPENGTCCLSSEGILLITAPWNKS